MQHIVQLVFLRTWLKFEVRVVGVISNEPETRGKTKKLRRKCQAFVLINMMQEPNILFNLEIDAVTVATEDFKLEIWIT